MQRLTTVIPVYNGERYLAETLQSVATQSRRPDRLVVLDNCSTDGTRKVVERFNGMPCEWRQNEKNLGLFGNCNRALEFAAETDFLHILHADDVLIPTFYETLLKSGSDMPGRALIYSGCDFIDENSLAIAASRADLPEQQARQIAVRTFLIGRSELRPFYFPTVVLKTNRQPSPCQFRMDMPQLADLVFWADWASHCERIIETQARLCHYRIHQNNDTSRNVSSLQAWVLDEWKAMQLIKPLLGEKGLPRWIRQQKLKCILAARAHVKIKLVQGNSPEFARQIHESVRATTGLAPWSLGKLAVGLRDFLLYNRKK
ncbi:glycosyltransferase family 2 protein [Pedosphaera parvula]|uniref:Glycosyl transferase family 2 n=1 Tax=Pedosphaera parvula (strain Ellin514) TaxID=320771 RepID=B9XIP9_PEDPL|nr:glycosyltransferase family A protein [Pedosphaera parvula]EEF60312.1 glycosyl transferase family 2 [Pedosphaera parvula Ellin514]